MESIVSLWSGTHWAHAPSTAASMSQQVKSMVQLVSVYSVVSVVTNNLSEVKTRLAHLHTTARRVGSEDRHTQ